MENVRQDERVRRKKTVIDMLANLKWNGWIHINLVLNITKVFYNIPLIFLVCSSFLCL